MKNLLKKIGKRFTEKLEKLADDNRKFYGERKLDCCTINTINRTPSVK
jgi:hypothetical protein